MTALIKYGLGGVLVVVALYNSVYFKKLDEVKAATEAKAFSAAQYAANFWETQLIPNLDAAVNIDSLVALLTNNPEKAFEDHSNALGIGNLRYFLVSGKGEVATVNEDNVDILIVSEKGDFHVTLATEFVFGNAIRDASGLIDINEFDNTMDFNNVSAEINKIVREQVLPEFRSTVKAGLVVEFTGAIELNREHFDLSKIEVLPVSLTLM